MFSILAAKRTISHSAAAVFGIELAAVLALSLTSALMTSLPARAQGFFDDRYPFLQQDRFRRQQPQFEEERPPNFSRAPAPKKVETPPASTIMVFGDAMADWLAYGLEDAFADTPEIRIVPCAFIGITLVAKRLQVLDGIGSAMATRSDMVNFYCPLLV